jgi:hypothetical protein
MYSITSSARPFLFIARYVWYERGGLDKSHDVEYTDINSTATCGWEALLKEDSMFKKISFLLAIGFIAVNAGACAQRSAFGGGPMMSSGYGGGSMRNSNPCPMGGQYDPDAQQCHVEGPPTAYVPDDPHCRGVPPGTQFDVPARGPHGEAGVDHRVCGTRS